MSFKEALHTVSIRIVDKILYPTWAMGLTKRLRHVRDAFKELDVRPCPLLERRNELLNVILQLDYDC